MKRVLSVLLLLTMYHLANAQECTIRVHVVAPPPEAAITVKAYDEPITWKEVTLDSVFPDSAGYATLSFSVDQPKMAEFHVGEQYAKLFLEPGMDLSIDVVYADFDNTISHKGATRANQQYLLKELLHDFQTPQTKYTLFDDAKVYSTYIDSLQQSHREFYRASDTTQMTPVFRDYVRLMIECQYHYSRDMFSVLYDRETQQFSERTLPDWYYDNLKTLDLNGDQYVLDGHYYTAVRLYLVQFAISKWNDVARTYDEIKQALKGKVRDVQLASYLEMQLTHLAQNPVFGDSLINDYKGLCTTPQYSKIISELYAVSKRLAKGQPVPVMQAADKNGVVHSIEELRGKVVYVDIWATWCLPCIAAMRASHDLRTEFKDDDVAFVYINYVDDVKKWNTYTTSNDLGTYNWYADAKQSEHLRSALNINGIPRYMIIDRDGTIVKSQASGPDAVSKELRALLTPK